MSGNRPAWIPVLILACGFTAPSHVSAKDEPYLFTPAGFDKVGKPAVARGDKIAHLHVTVRDARTGSILFLGRVSNPKS